MRAVMTTRRWGATLADVVTGYLGAVTDRIADVLGAQLVGVYTTGSLALGDFRPHRSDIDLMAVVAGSADLPLRQELADRLDHRALPCPAAGLELVLYPQATVAGATVDAGYLLNLNTGRALTPLASFDPGEGEGFWYPIDRDVTWQSGRALLGPAPREVFARVPYERLLPVVCASIEARTTGLEERDLLDNAVLNGCRALRFGAERRWYAKLAAAQRTLPTAGEFAPLVRAAMASFRSGRDGALVLPAEVVGAFLGEVLRRLR